ncbi:hypothetical protein E2C01_065570 [Portunus trituberculatus]|uniref:Uncharacterized protein n=1 Tax=Portunus trituberculatus TaxID=210409 RepID=A0A5B7HPY7_PORTR|nr:hypothetical protein [Portunus trituberculatus]
MSQASQAHGCRVAPPQPPQPTAHSRSRHSADTAHSSLTSTHSMFPNNFTATRRNTQERSIQV